MAHAKLSPSASHRWMNCPGSVALIGDESSTTNSAAMMGTAAHKIIELMIQRGIDDAREFAGSAVLVKADGDEETEVYAPGEAAISADKSRPGWFMFMVDEKMVAGVQTTIDEVNRIKETLFSPEVFSERYLDMRWLDSRLGGTADVTLVEPFGWAHLVDHKNGYITVEAKDNDQLKQYGVGILHEHPDVDGVTVTISQPNAPHIEGTIRSESFTRDELKLYEIRMKEAADATSAPNAPLRCGDWCTFCPAMSRCKAFDEMMAEEAGLDFSDEAPPVALPMPKSTAELAQKAKWIDVISGWVSRVKADIQTELENGNEVEGWKLVRGRANRKWINPAETQRVLVEEVGLEDADLWVEPKMKSPAQLEKLGIGKEQRKLVKSKIRELAETPNGQLTIAPLTDPRDAAQPEDGENDFAGLNDEEDFI